MMVQATISTWNYKREEWGNWRTRLVRVTVKSIQRGEHLLVDRSRFTLHAIPKGVWWYHTYGDSNTIHSEWLHMRKGDILYQVAFDRISEAMESQE